MTVEDYILNLESPLHQQLSEAAHNLIVSLVPQVTYSVKWSVPYYQYHKALCYISPKKNSGIELCFHHGRLLSNEQGLLDMKNRKQIAGIEINDLEFLYHEAIAEVILEASTINEELQRSGKGDWFSEVHKKK